MSNEVREALARLIEVYDAMGAPRGPARIMAEAALAASPQAEPERTLVKVSSIDVEKMLAECVPGGHSCDPQEVADNIRRYCNAWEPAQAEPDGWQQLYRRAINEANGLTNYVEDRPELRSADKRLAKIEEEARMLSAAPKRSEG